MVQFCWTCLVVFEIFLYFFRNQLNWGTVFKKIVLVEKLCNRCNISHKPKLNWCDISVQPKWVWFLKIVSEKDVICETEAKFLEIYCEIFPGNLSALISHIWISRNLLWPCSWILFPHRQNVGEVQTLYWQMMTLRLNVVQ